MADHGLRDISDSSDHQLSTELGFSPAEPETQLTAPRWRVFEDITHGYWGIEEDIHDGNTILYPKKINREALDGIVRAHNAALAAEGRS